MNLEPMKCGNCGKRRVTLRARPMNGNRDTLAEIRARCCHCKSVTVFSIPAPAIAPNAEGVLCIGWRR
jgi:hypothetical protein